MIGAERPDPRSPGPVDRRDLRRAARSCGSRRTASAPVLADRYEGKRFGGPNDVVVKRDGAIYFTDGNGAYRLGNNDPRRELMSPAVYMWKDGKVTPAVTDMPGYNGLAFSPDEKYLYVNASVAKFVNRYEVRPDDSLANGKLLIDISKEPGQGITDGMRVDTKGNLYETLRAVESGSFHRTENISARSTCPKCPPTWHSATPTRRRSTSRRAPESTGSE
jgi:sugar lactone lactonase YvrE